MNMDQKQIESNDFKLFRRLLKKFPQGEVFHEDNPDFLIRSQSGTLGIEHRKLYKLQEPGEHSLKATESLIDQILCQTREHAELQGMPPVHVALFFCRDLVISKSDIPSIARDISLFIQANFPEIGKSVDLEYEASLQGTKPEILDVASVYRFENITRHHWDAPVAGWIKEDIRTELQNAIDEKAVNLARYLKKCDECWLLIVADGSKPSSSLQPDVSSTDHQYSSPFSSTYFLDCMRNRVIELKTSQ